MARETRFRVLDETGRAVARRLSHGQCAIIGACAEQRGVAVTFEAHAPRLPIVDAIGEIAATAALFAGGYGLLLIAGGMTP